MLRDSHKRVVHRGGAAVVFEGVAFAWQRRLEHRSVVAGAPACLRGCRCRCHEFDDAHHQPGGLLGGHLAYFDEKGLVRQLDSHEFIMNTMQEIVDESSTSTSSRSSSSPLMQTSGATSTRSPLVRSTSSADAGGAGPDDVGDVPQRCAAAQPDAAPLYMDLTRTTISFVNADGEEDEEVEDHKIFLGQVLIMLRTMYCILS